MTLATPEGKTLENLKDLAALVGREVGVSGWIVLDQPRIDAFADTTLDHQFIHVDPLRAAGTPFGGTIAHGFLTLSLLSVMCAEAMPALTGAGMMVNYGFERVRFVSPVPAGARVRGHFTLAEVKARGAGQSLSRWQVSVELEGAERPALVAEWHLLTSD